MYNSIWSWSSLFIFRSDWRVGKSLFNFLSLFFTNIVTHTIKRVQFVKGVVCNDLIIVAVTKKYPQIIFFHKIFRIKNYIELLYTSHHSILAVAILKRIVLCWASWNSTCLMTRNIVFGYRSDLKEYLFFIQSLL